MLYSNYRGVINWIDNLFIRDIRMGSIPFSTTIIRKSIMKNKLTLIKVCNKDYKPSASDLEHWRAGPGSVDGGLSRIDCGPRLWPKGSRT